MPLAMEVSLSPGDIMLYGDPAISLPKGHSPPQFSAHVCCGQTAGGIKLPLGTEVGLGLGHIVLDGDSASPKGAQPLPNFRPISIVTKWSPISATAEHFVLLIYDSDLFSATI